MFAGGEAVDIACTYGLSKTDVHDSPLHHVIAAVNSHPDLKIEFPSSHAEQHKIAAGFHKKSKADIKRCVGCIDGMLVWMLKPTEAGGLFIAFFNIAFFLLSSLLSACMYELKCASKSLHLRPRAPKSPKFKLCEI